MEDRTGKIIENIRWFIVYIGINTILYIILLILIQGMWLWGIPDEEDVENFTISYPSVTETIKTYEEDRKIEQSVDLVRFLNYIPFKTADTSKPPLITITYYTNDGQTLTVSANNDTVWWKDKAYALKDDETFIKLAEGIFFLDEIE